MFLHTSVQIHCQQLNPWDIPLSWNNETNNKTLFYLNKQRVNWLDIHVTQIEFGQGRIINFLRSNFVTQIYAGQTRGVYRSYVTISSLKYQSSLNWTF